MSKKYSNQNRYKALIEKIFFDRYSLSVVELPFQRIDMEIAG